LKRREFASRLFVFKGLKMKTTLEGKKVLITDGPTREYLDPVRFVTNESSGKMGYAIARELINREAEVILISGPVVISTDNIPNLIKVVSATEMFTVCKGYFTDVDIAIFTAAVADYRPKVFSEQKIKKSDQATTMELIKNPDIASEFGKVKSGKQLSIGFALETTAMIENASKKMIEKNFDAIVINSPGKDEGFGHDTNRISILSKDHGLKSYPLKSKIVLAVDIVNEIERDWIKII
jgi:phosphopantothenoylcysteine decarboxylase/phosphopantothenate--cysteine ligase